MTNPKSEIQIKRVKLQIKNAPIEIASGITHQLYQMVDKKELDSISIEDVHRSEHSVDILIAIGIFLGGYVANKMLDVPVNQALAKIHRNLQVWKQNKKQKKIDFFIDDKHLE